MLSDNAKKLYEAIKLNGGWMHEDNAISVIFPKPTYPTKEEENREEKQRVYWQWDISLYGGERESPVGDGFEKFTCPFENSFDRVAFAAWQEIKKAGLGYSKNNGYNSYTYFVK